MTQLFESLINRGPMPALTATMAFTHARHNVIAENVANMGTPGYKARHLDYDAFQEALGEAMQKRSRNNTTGIELDNGEVEVDAAGHLTVHPQERPGRNIVFHDGSNLSIEKEMSDLSSNAMLHEMTTNLLQGRFESLRKAIRGRM